MAVKGSWLHASLMSVLARLALMLPLAALPLTLCSRLALTSLRRCAVRSLSARCSGRCASAVTARSTVAALPRAVRPRGLSRNHAAAVLQLLLPVDDDLLAGCNTAGQNHQ